jgi:hypothetical protein
MTARMRVAADALEQMHADLRGEVEQVGFFLARLEPDGRTLTLGEWMPIPSEGFEFQSGYHVSLDSEVVATLLGRAAAEECSLVEVHSHLGAALAEFSFSDIRGLREWVPQMRWRLRRRPYAAIVVAEGSLDALAWINGGAEQVEALVTEDKAHVATGLTLAGLAERGADVSL